MTTPDLDLDHISLEQALIDFEVANARVIDLTKRLTSLSKEVLSLRGELELERTRRASLQSDQSLAERRAYILTQLTQSRALRLMSRFAGKLKSALEQAEAVSQ